MTEIKKAWTELKSFLSSKGGILQYEDQIEQYKIWFEDGQDKYFCFIEQETPASSDQEDFETNYKDKSNKPMRHQQDPESMLDKYYEEDDVPLKGSKERILIIPDREIWNIQIFGGSSNNNACEVQIIASLDGGVTWGNPWDTTASKIRSIHLDKGVVGNCEFLNPLKFTGSGTDTQLKLVMKNYNTTISAEIDCWFNGYKV